MFKIRCLLTFCLIVFCSNRILIAGEANQGGPIEKLQAFLKDSENSFGDVMAQSFVNQPLTKAESVQASKMLIDAWKQNLATEREAELNGAVLEIGNHEMKLFMREFGEKPEAGWSVYISMHGGGGTHSRGNDQQWENQKKLYQLNEGIYVAPRAPTDSWNMWHQTDIDQFYDRLITNLIIGHDVNPNRVYILGYSAGGDGVFQLAPRMADRFAAAAMMAGHPNDAAVESLRNLPFTIHMGELDHAFNRNKKAAIWKKKLADRHAKDPEGYTHEVQIHQGKGHWMDRKDAVAIPWMAQFSRRRFPKKVVWQQSNVKHKRFYWLALSELPAKRPLIVAQRDGQTVTIEKSDVDAVSILINDQMLDMDQEISFYWGRELVQAAKVNRTIGQLATSLIDRGDPEMMFSGRIEVRKPQDVTSAIAP